MGPSPSARLGRAAVLGAAALGCLVGAGIPAAPLGAQQAFRGTVIDDATGRGVPQASVTLLRDGSAVSAVAADDEGSFFLPTELVGEVVLEAAALGYATARSQAVELMSGDTLTVEIRVLPDAILMAPLLVTGNSNLGRNLFERRRSEWGKGVFLGPEQIAAMELRHPADVFRDRNDMRIRWRWGRTLSGATGPLPDIRTYRGSGCLKYMVDRTPVRLPGSRSAQPDPWTIFPLDGLQPEDIRAVEIYRYVGEAPPEIRRHATWDDEAMCGLVVIWTWVGW